MIIGKETLRCTKCQSGLTVTKIIGKNIERDEVEVLRFKEWHKKHGERCQETEKTNEEVTI